VSMVRHLCPAEAEHNGRSAALRSDSPDGEPSDAVLVALRGRRAEAE
jgi:hypothetical protein